MSTSSSSSSSLIEPAPPTERVHRTAHFEAVTASQPSATVVTTRGELDAANSQHFSDFALRHAAGALVLDLTGVEFFGTAGFSALHTLNVRCAGAGIDWILVPSAAVSRLLRICDPDAALPWSETVDSALAALEGGARPLLQLVAEPS